MTEVEELIHKIVSGELNMSREERQVYVNHSQEIEKRLTEIEKDLRGMKDKDINYIQF
jgi:hypothetical protein